jgi:hypothetical protein
MRYSLADNELKALIQLLDDPDTGVYENVSSRLISFGKNVIPHLECEWEIKTLYKIELNKSFTR